MRDFLIQEEILSAAAATGAGTAKLIPSFRHKNITLGTTGMGSGDTIVVKCQGSFKETSPDFDATATVANDWDYVQMIDLNDGSIVDGDTGVTFSDSDSVRLFAINVDGLRWVNLEVTTISDTSNTSVTGKISVFND